MTHKERERDRSVGEEREVFVVWDESGGDVVGFDVKSGEERMYVISFGAAALEFPPVVHAAAGRDFVTPELIAILLRTFL